MKESPIRDIILKRLDEMSSDGNSWYWLSQRVKSHVKQQSVYTFLNGKTEMTSGKLWYLLEALDLNVMLPEKVVIVRKIKKKVIKARLKKAS